MIVRPLEAEAPLLPGLRIGQAKMPGGKSGVTVCLFDTPALGGAALIGRATSTRQADSLRAAHHVRHLDAFVFTGGSAFGLGAGDGALRYLVEHGRGLPTRYGLVPICPTAAIYDLGFAEGTPRPDAACAYAACEAARAVVPSLGAAGAGAGATIGKLFGLARASKGGVGMAEGVEDGLRIQALAVVNAFGDIRDPASGAIVSGARDETGRAFADSARLIAEGHKPPGFAPKEPAPEHTTLVALFTNAALSKLDLVRLAHRAAKGFARVLSPPSPFDGDLVFAAALGTCADFSRPALDDLAARTLEAAILSGAGAARSAES